MRRFHFSLCVLLFIGGFPAAAKTAPNAASTVTVKKGETLYSIARAYGFSAAQLRALNHLSGTTIRVGQRLKVQGEKLTILKAQPQAVSSGKKSSQNQRGRAALSSSHSSSAGSAHSSVRSSMHSPVHPTSRAHSSAAAQSYTVRPGDTLGQIAKSHGLGTPQLRRWNHLSSSVVTAGQKLQLVAPPTAVAAQVKSGFKGHPDKSQGTYTVRGGDNLGEISSRYGVTVLALQTANHLQGTVITVGQKLLIPPRGARGVPSLPSGLEARTIYTYVRVSAGQTPSSFAGLYATTPDAIRRLNALITMNQIVPGAKLLVPSRMAVPVPPRPAHQALTLRQVTVRGVCVQVVQVDLRHRDVLVSPVLPRTGSSFDSGATVSALTSRSGANALVNGSYFHPQTYAPAGDIVMEGRLLTWGRIPAALAITPDNRASITGSTTALFGRPLDSTWNGMETVIASGPRIVQGGVAQSAYSSVFQDPAVFGQAARSAIGLISSRDLLLVSTHSKLSVGEMGRVMAALGARDALLLDGGSSAGLSFNGSTVLNSVRKVSYGIGVFTNYTGRRYAR